MSLIRSLRGRLVIAAAVAVLLAVAGVGAGAAEFVTHELSTTLDASLRARAGDVARLSASAPSLLTSPGIIDSATGGRQLDVEIVDARGRIVSRSLSLGARVLPATATVQTALHAGRSGYENVTVDGRALRLYAAPLADTGGQASGGAVVVASQIGDIDTIGRHLRAGLLVFGAIAGLFGAAIAAVLVTRALRPLRALSRGASAIEQTGRPTRRLEVPKTNDEVHDLAAALNRMLGALAATQERERRLLADASHELRTPLTSLLGNIDFLAAHGASSELVEDLRHDAARLRRLVEDLLVLEREGATVPVDEPTDLAAVITEAAAGRDRVDLLIDGPVMAPGDSSGLLRAVTNLIENALIHGPADGRVRVRLREQAGIAEISVSDEGAGIPAEAGEVAFERFWRGPDAAERPGSGLGLAIVRTVAERHGGNVLVDGATVTMVLPSLRVGERLYEEAPAVK
jgi:signal transduction histidine kinase